jgi:predicted DNA-binding protein (MmcQ/YjbR family)
VQNLTVARAKITKYALKNVEVLHEWCLAQPETAMDYPFGDGVRVYKVAAKMFALIPELEDPASISLKCDPLDAQVLRQKYAAVTAGYHLNKKHWNTICADGEVPDAEIRAWIEDSFDLVVDSLPKAKRLLIQGQVKAIDS